MCDFWKAQTTQTKVISETLSCSNDVDDSYDDPEYCNDDDDTNPHPQNPRGVSGAHSGEEVQGDGVLG